MIGATQDGSLAARFGNHRSGVVPAHVVESSQQAVITAHNYNWFASHVCRNELSGRCHLLRTSDHLPGPAENRCGFELGNARINVPRPGDGRRFLQRRICVVSRENVMQCISWDHRLS
jgi:hypothetical protein